MIKKILEIANISIFFAALAAMIYFTARKLIFSEGWADFSTIETKHLAICALLYLFSHGGRLLRFIVILVDRNRQLRRIVSFYAFWASARFALPFKLGELFRISELSHFLGSYKTGVFRCGCGAVFSMQ